MNLETIEIHYHGPVARLTLNRPDKLNAINSAMLDEINSALDEIESRSEVYAMALNGNGRGFCAGFDLKAGIEANRRGEKQWRDALQYDLDVMMRFWNFSKPVIAVVHGCCLAAGFELALACDLTVCDPESYFGEPELRFGSSIAALLLPWYTNPKQAKKILLTGEDRITAEQALRLGIVNEISEAGESLAAGMALAEKAALMDPDSVRLTKRAINRTYEIMGLSKALDMGVDTAVEIETLETGLRREFNRIFREEGLKAALAWREKRLNSERPSS